MIYCNIFVIFIVAEKFSPIRIDLITILDFEDGTMSYHILKWIIKDKGGITNFILQINNLKTINMLVRGTYLFQKDKHDAGTLSIISLDKCNRLNGMSNSVLLAPNIACK